MYIPLNTADIIVIILFVLSGIFMYYGIKLDHSGYLLLSIIEFILGFVQLMINKNPVIFVKNNF